MLGPSQIKFKLQVAQLGKCIQALISDTTSRPISYHFVPWYMVKSNYPGFDMTQTNYTARLTQGL